VKSLGKRFQTGGVGVPASKDRVLAEAWTGHAVQPSNGKRGAQRCPLAHDGEDDVGDGARIWY
jgi:hypothetical protein